MPSESWHPAAKAFLLLDLQACSRDAVHSPSLQLQAADAPSYREALESAAGYVVCALYINVPKAGRVERRHGEDRRPSTVNRQPSKPRLGAGVTRLGGERVLTCGQL